VEYPEFFDICGFSYGKVLDEESETAESKILPPHVRHVLKDICKRVISGIEYVDGKPVIVIAPQIEERIKPISLELQFTHQYL